MTLNFRSLRSKQLSFDAKLRGDGGSFCFFETRMRFMTLKYKERTLVPKEFSPVWAQIIWTFDIKLAEISAK